MPNESVTGIATGLRPGLPTFRFPQIAPTLRRVAAVLQAPAFAAADLAAICVATAVGSYIHGPFLGPPMVAPPATMDDLMKFIDPRLHGSGFAVVLIIILSHLGARGHYAHGIPPWTRTLDVISAVALAGLCDIFLTFPLDDNTPLHVAGHAVMWLGMAPAIFAGRWVARAAVAGLGVWDMRVVLFGAPEQTAMAADAISTERHTGLRVVGCFERNEVGDPGIAENWRHLVASKGGNFVALVGSPDDAPCEARAMVALGRAGIPFALIPATGGLPVMRWRPRYFFSHDVLMLVHHAGRPGMLSRAVKRAMDVTAALLLLVLFAPLMLTIALLIRRDGGPALFHHKRIGAGGRVFLCAKFRSMRVDAAAVLDELLANDPAAAAEWAATQKLRNDPRVTGIGRLLRRTSLDELPQLLNILRGEMSLVGPRPIVASEARFYGEHIHDYYTAKPGVTGLWQVSGRSDTSYARRVQLDVWYARNRSLWHDLRIIAKTVPVVLLRKGAV
jgi:undecaprenyl-phosphate galactose phosphotransferase